MKIAFRRTYDFVCSIGHYCATAHFLRRHFLRRMSGPLDWNAQDSGHGLELVTNLICSDFAGFLEKESLQLLDHSVSPMNDADCDYYRDTKSKVVFYHDFPRGASLDDVYAGVKNKYDRRIAKFYASVRESKKTLLVFHTRSDHPSDSEMSTALKNLRAKLGDHIDLLVIENVPDLTVPEVRTLADGLISVRCWFFRPEIHWIYGDLALTDSIYSAIPMRGKFRQRLRHIVLRILASLHFSRAKRQAARRRLFG